MRVSRYSHKCFELTFELTQILVNGLDVKNDEVYGNLYSRKKTWIDTD